MQSIALPSPIIIHQSIYLNSQISQWASGSENSLEKVSVKTFVRRDYKIRRFSQKHLL